MKNMKIAIGLIFPLIFLSGCTQFLNTSKAQFVTQKEISTNDLYYTVDIYPSEIYSGETLKMRIRLIPERDIEDVKVEIVDPCLFEMNEEKTQNIGNLHKGMKKMVIFDLKSQNVEMPTNCRIKFKINYTTSFNLVQDIAVLSSEEYRQREESGTLGEIEISSSKENSAVQPFLEFSETQPFKKNRKVQVYLQYKNLGDGIVKKLENVEIYFPENLEEISCASPYESEGNNRWSLSKTLEFYDKETEKTVCTAETKANSPVDIEKILVTGKYKYEIEDNINVEILRG